MFFSIDLLGNQDLSLFFLKNIEIGELYHERLYDLITSVKFSEKGKYLY